MSCPESQSCKGKRYFNIYYPDPTTTDKAIYSGNNVIDLISDNGKTAAQEYIGTKIQQKLTNKRDMVLQGSNTYNAHEGFQTKPQKFWTDDIMELVNCKTIYDLVPDKGDTIENYLNAMVRASVAFALFMMIITGYTGFIYIIVGVMVSTVFMYYNEIINKPEETFVDVPNVPELRNDQEAACTTDNSCDQVNKETTQRDSPFKEKFGDGLDRREQNLFKTLSEIVGEEIADRNTVKLDPMHIPDKPFEMFLFGGRLKRKIYNYIEKQMD